MLSATVRVERNRRVEEGEEEGHKGVDRRRRTCGFILREVAGDPLDPHPEASAELGNHRRQSQIEEASVTGITPAMLIFSGM